MSNLIISKTPDVETILVNNLQDYFFNHIKFKELFRGKEVKITTDHPFVNLFQQQVDDDKYDLTGFPCITVIDANTEKAVQANIAPQVYRITNDLVTDINQYGRDKYLISKQTLTALKEALKGQEFIRAEGYETHKRSKVAIEIWAANAVIKNVLYDLTDLFFSASDWLFTLHQNYGILIEENSIVGEKSGIYNYDFGGILYGAMINMGITYQIAQYTIKDFTLGDNAVVVSSTEQ